jgi:hypothetical protein
MNTKHKTFWDMQKLCITYVQKKNAVWQNNATIKKLVDALIASEAGLESTAVEQDGSKTNGHTEQKNLAFETHAAKMYKLGRKLTLYAKNTNNAILRAKADVSESKIDSLSDDNALILFASMLLLARTEQANLADYGITAQELDSLEAQQTQMKQLIAQRNAVSQTHHQATRGINEQVADARLILSKLDDAFEGMIDDDAFIAGWFDVRKIKGRRQTTDDSEQPETNVTTAKA